MELSHVGIWCVDWKKAERFYRQVLGLQPISSYEVSGEIMETIFGVEGPCQVRVYGLDHGTIEVFDAPKGVESGINHFAVSVQDKRSFCKEVAAKGAQVLEVWRGDHPVYFLRGPSGLLVEVRE